MSVVIISMLLIILVALAVGALVWIGLSGHHDTEGSGPRAAVGRLGQVLNGDRHADSFDHRDDPED